MQIFPGKPILLAYVTSLTGFGGYLGGETGNQVLSSAVRIKVLGNYL
jgi:hypothetical protein